MYRITVIVGFVLAMACRPSLKQMSPNQSESVSIGNKDSCRFPYQVSSETIFNTGLQTYLKFTGKRSYPYPIATLYDKIPIREQDSFALECQNYLYSKLGKVLYCNNLYVTPNSFGMIRDELQDRRIIKFKFLMPGMITRKPDQWTGKKLDAVEFEFTLDLKNKVGRSIIFPKNVPDCGNSTNCNYTINRDSAILIAKANHFINDTAQYSLNSDGLNWIMTTGKGGSDPFRKIIINMQTGVSKWEQSLLEDHGKRNIRTD